MRNVDVQTSELPEYDFSGDGKEDILQEFEATATASGIKVQHLAADTIMEYVRNLGTSSIQSTHPVLKAEYPLKFEEQDPYNAENIPDIFICKAHFGVAENAAMWLDDKVLQSRILAFLPEKIILVLSAVDIVANMHQAYARIENDDFGYGLFMAGPSKTADIEQTLVTGAQGAKELTVLIL